MDGTIPEGTILTVDETALDRIVNRPDGEPVMEPCVCGAPLDALRLTTRHYYATDMTWDATITCAACGFALTRLRSSEMRARLAVVTRWNAARPLTPPADIDRLDSRPERRPDNTEDRNG